MRYWKIAFTFLFVLLVLSMLLQASRGVAQDDGPTPVSTILQRPSLASTGLPPVITQTPPQSTPRTRTPTRTTTPSETPTDTLTPTRTPSPTSSSTPTATHTATATPSPTNTPSATRTPSSTSTATATPSFTGTVTASLSATVTDSATATHTHTATNTATPTDTPTATETPTATHTPTATATATYTPEPINVISSPDTDATGSGDSGLGPLMILGIVIFLSVAAYVIAYALTSADLDRYSTGFVVQQCPVCEDGNLILDERPYRSLGILRARRTVRCDNCRSVLREVGTRRWRYTVDPQKNELLFEDYNGAVVTEAELFEMSIPAQSNLEEDTPVYVDEDLPLSYPTDPTDQ